MVGCILDDVFTPEELVGHQLALVVLEVSQHVRHSVVDWFHHPVVDIRKVRFLICGNDLLHESLLHSRHFSKQTHSLGVCDPHIGIRVGGFAARYDERTQVIWVDKGSGWDERVLLICEY